MRRIACALLLLAALVGCGDNADDGDGTAKPSPGPGETGLVQILVLTSAGGEPSTTAYFVDDRKAMKAYVKTFEDSDDVTVALQQAVKNAGDRDGRLAVATLAVGCDVPPGVSITEGDDGPEVHPDKVVDPIPECFAPTTSIALVEVARPDQ